MYDFKCSGCKSVNAYHLTANDYENESSRINCLNCNDTNLSRFFGNQNVNFSGMFHEVTIGGQTFSTETQKKAFEKENGYIPLSYEENIQETTKNKNRIDKEQSSKRQRDIQEICQKAIHKNSS
tara:strand:- start:4520 stop:4891 length:372 start_codon:yes stop_codon:yes gene_type:complete